MHLIQVFLQDVKIYSWLKVESLIVDLELLRFRRLQLYLFLAQNDWTNVIVLVNVRVATARPS